MEKPYHLWRGGGDRDLILAEKEESPAQEFLAKLDVFLKLLNKEIP